VHFRQKWYFRVTF